MRNWKQTRWNGVWMMALTSMIGMACSRPTHAAAELPKPMEYSLDKTAKAGETRTALFAGGCFWCVEGVFEQLAGVKDATSGYAGGTKETANYKAVCTGTTSHAEAVFITYDPSKITYSELLRIFFTTHDPTTKNRQGNDVGPQYRSVIFVTSPEQAAMARQVRAEMANVWNAPLVTEIAPVATWYKAEHYHQAYFRQHPLQGYCALVVASKLAKFRETFANRLK